MESDSLNAIYWVSSIYKFPWRFQFYFNEINSFLAWCQFQHIGGSMNSFANALAKQGVDRSSDFIAVTL